MIEIIYDEAEAGKESPEVPVRLPKNLRQIGEGAGDTKIYIEDYVMTFIRKLWDKKDGITAGILLGEVKRSGRETYIFIPGAINISSEYINQGDGQQMLPPVQFTDAAWNSIYAVIKRFFNRYMIVGWFVNRSESCREPGQTITKVHLDNFPGADKILFLSDTSEKEEKIYRYEGGALTEQPAYYVYYERNGDMQEYMISGGRGEAENISDTSGNDALVNSAGIAAAAKDRTENPTSQAKTASVNSDSKTSKVKTVLVSGFAGTETGAPPEPDASAAVKDNVPTGYRSRLKERKEEKSQRRMLNILYGACTFLAFVVLMIGVAMMNNYDKMESLERLVSDLYKTAMGQPFENNKQTDVNESEKSVEIQIPTSSDNINETTDAGRHETGSSTETTESTGDEQQTSETQTESTSNDETSASSGTENQTTDTENPNVEEGIMYHVVVAGDTLTSISRKFYNTDKMVEAIKELNGIENGDIIYPGQVIKLP